MKITKQTRFVTNGKIVIRLGRYSPCSWPAGKKGQGSFLMCTDYPKGAGSHYITSHLDGIFEGWLIGKFRYMEDFFPIKRRLLSAQILKVLER